MADDQRERQPLRDQGDNPPEDGIRSDLGGSSATAGGVAPGGAAVERADDRSEPPPSGGDGGSGPADPDPLDHVKHPTADE